MSVNVSKCDFVVSRILGDGKAILLVRHPDGTNFYHQCRNLSKSQGLKGGETIECVEGAVKIMIFADCCLYELYAKPTQNQNRSVTLTDLGYEQYHRRRGGRPKEWVAIPASHPYQPKFAGGSNR